MKKRTLPPLPTLRAFDAAARHLSFKKAADELCVTPSAISHHIQHLEDYLQTKLFNRYNRKLTLSDAGSVYWKNIQIALDEIEFATRDIAELGGGKLLTFSAPPTFIQSWLIPKLNSFRKIYSDLNLRFVDTLEKLDFQNDRIDAAIWYGYNDWRNMHSDFIFKEDLCIVCSPTLLHSSPALNNLDDLRKHTLIHTERRLISWKNIFNDQHSEDIDSRKGLRFLHSTHSLQAAIQGLGVAIGNKNLIGEHIKREELIIPFEIDTSEMDVPSYYFVCPKENINIEKVQSLRTWILNKVKKQQPI